MKTDLQLVTPFPPEHYPQLWAWMLEFPLQNLDDDGPKSLEEFTAHMQAKEAAGETSYEIIQLGQPVGIIVIQRYTFIHPRAKFAGVCFSKEVHGKGVALEAIKTVLQKTFDGGAESVVASYFSDNIAIHKMFQKLGMYTYCNKRKQVTRPMACEVGKFPHPVTRNGQAVTMTMITIDRDAFRKVYGGRDDQADNGPSEAVQASARGWSGEAGGVGAVNGQSPRQLRILQ